MNKTIKSINLLLVQKNMVIFVNLMIIVPMSACACVLNSRYIIIFGFSHVSTLSYVLVHWSTCTFRLSQGYAWLCVDLRALEGTITPELTVIYRSSKLRFPNTRLFKSWHIFQVSTHSLRLKKWLQVTGVFIHLTCATWMKALLDVQTQVWCPPPKHALRTF